MRRTLLLVTLCLVVSGTSACSDSTEQPTRPPNVLFVSIDDLNDWVGAFGGHPLAKTPHLDALAADGAMLFRNAHCPGPACGPSRSAVLSGFMPQRTGVYTNFINMRESELVQTHATLPEYFSRNGYLTLSRGKIAHQHFGEQGMDQGQWMFDVWSEATGRLGPLTRTLTSRNKNLIDGQPATQSALTERRGSEFAWGVARGPTEEVFDRVTADWAAEQLARPYDQPFFLAVGIFRPHLPFFAPQEFWDLYPVDQNYLPEINENDFDDILLPNGDPAGGRSLDYQWLEANGLRNEAARAYLACVSYADHCLGVILDALDQSPHADNTIVVVWGDHGWHLGEKLRYRKHELWSESTRCPLLVKLPGRETPRECVRPVNLIDLFPTLVELCGLPEKAGIDGRSLVALFDDPTREWYPTVTVHAPQSASVHDERWNLISRRNGVRELYDLEQDPMEWTNLYAEESTAEVRARLEGYLPESYLEPGPTVPGDIEKSKDIDSTIRSRRLARDLK